MVGFENYDRSGNHFFRVDLTRFSNKSLFYTLLKMNFKKKVICVEYRNTIHDYMLPFSLSPKFKYSTEQIASKNNIPNTNGTHIRPGVITAMLKICQLT